MINLVPIQATRRDNRDLSSTLYDLKAHPHLRRIHSRLGSTISDYLYNQGIHVQEKRVPMDSLVDLDNTYYTISSEVLFMYPLRVVKRFLENHNVAIIDFIEGGLLMAIELEKMRDCVPKNLVIIHSSFVDIDFPNTRNIHVPSFFTMSYDFHQKPVAHASYRKRAIIPVCRAKDFRLAALDVFDRRGLLAVSDWSCIENLHTVDLSKYTVATKYQLPRSIDSNTTTEMLYDWPDEWNGKYAWHVVIETDEETRFFTEKTGKGFLTHSGTLAVNPHHDAYMTKLGFEVEHKLGHLSFGERLEAICDIALSSEPDQEIIKHNQALMCDKDWQVKTFCDPIVRGFAEIESKG